MAAAALPGPAEMTLPGLHKVPTWGSRWRAAATDDCGLTEQPLDQPGSRRANMSLCWLHLCPVSNTCDKTGCQDTDYMFTPSTHSYGHQ